MNKRTHIILSLLISILMPDTLRSLDTVRSWLNSSMGSTEDVNDLKRSTPEVEKLLNNPFEVVQKNNADYARFEKELAFGAPTVERYQELFEAYEEENPLFLLSECTGENDHGDCDLSRTINPKLRKNYGDKVSLILSEKIRKNKGSATLAGVGSGKMLQDLIILAETLQRYPQSDLTINLIDPTYMPLTIDGNILLESLEKNFPTTKRRGLLKNSSLKNTRTLDPKLARKFAIENNRRRQELLGFVKRNFPQAQLSLNLFTSVEEYLKDLEDHKKPYPDLVTATDLAADGMGAGTAAYLKLCYFALQNNPNSQNLILEKGWPDNILVRTYLTPVKDSKKLTAVTGRFIPFRGIDEYDDSEKVILFITEEHLK